MADNIIRTTTLADTEADVKLEDGHHAGTAGSVASDRETTENGDNKAFHRLAQSQEAARKLRFRKEEFPRRNIASLKLVGLHREVYEPCDDSFALVDALLADRVNLLQRQPSLCLEVGCGSGYVITSLALLMGPKNGIHYFATDISDVAAEVTRTTLASHGVEADVLVTDLVTGLEKRLAGMVDVLVFNPPYVPTPEEEVGAAGIVASWAGGARGRVVIDRMLGIVDSLISRKGLFYLVTLTANNPGEICQVMKRKGFLSRIITQRCTEEESLHVLKFWREDDREASEIGTTARFMHSFSIKAKFV